jgi:glycosyltransferase involved in cell wall biosynthesis
MTNALTQKILDYNSSSKKERIRDVLSNLTKIGLIKKPRFKTNGISFVIPVKNEKRTIEACILSIMDVADEIIVVDSSTDSTTTIISSLAKKHQKIKHIRFYCDDINSFALQLNIGLTCVRYKWVFKFDADMVAKKDIYKWKEKIDSLDKDKYYVVDCSHINLEGDVFHQPKGREFIGKEGKIFTWHPTLRWILKPNRVEQVIGDSIYGYRYPIFYKVIRFYEPYIFHVNIKNPKRMLERCFWTDYLRIKGRGFKNFNEYVRFRIKNDWNVSYEEALIMVNNRIKNNLVPYNKERFGDLPELIIKKVYSPKLEVITALGEPLISC